jgi:hypothetical protein
MTSRETLIFDVAAGDTATNARLFPQSEGEFSPAVREAIFQSYSHILPWDDLPPSPIGIDVGCGSWSAMVAPKVCHLHLLDACEDALSVAAEPRWRRQRQRVGDIPLDDYSLDFALSPGFFITYRISQPSSTLSQRT